MKKKRVLVVAGLVWCLLSAGFLFCAPADAAWIQGTIVYIKQIFDNATGEYEYEIRLLRTDGKNVTRKVHSSLFLSEFLAMALTAQASGAQVRLYRQSIGGGADKWSAIMIE